MSKKGITISIIVPVYNAKQTLEKCLDSILNQTYTSIEVILIDDGSTDGSWDICYKYQQKDSRVVAFRQTNKGPADARNRGISESKGEYLQFVDADDFITSNMSFELTKPIKQGFDLVICGYFQEHYFFKKNFFREKKPPRDGGYTKKEFINLFFLYFNKNGFLWNKLYKKDLIIHNDIKFLSEIKFAEDLLFNLEYLKYCSNIYLVDEPYYYYRFNANSLTRVFQTCWLQNINLILETANKFLLDEQSMNYQLKQELLRQHLFHLIFSIHHIVNTPKKNKQSKIDQINYLLSDPITQKVMCELAPINLLEKNLVGWIKGKKHKVLYLYIKARGIIWYYLYPMYILIKKVWKINNRNNIDN